MWSVFVPDPGHTHLFFHKYEVSDMWLAILFGTDSSQRQVTNQEMDKF